MKNGFAKIPWKNEWLTQPSELASLSVQLGVAMPRKIARKGSDRDSPGITVTVGHVALGRLVLASAGNAQAQLLHATQLMSTI